METDHNFWAEVDRLIDLALSEDIGDGDATSISVIPEEAVCRAEFVAREEGVLAGLDVIKRVYEKIDPRVKLTGRVLDGNLFQRGDVLAAVEGPARAILSGERTALNFIQRMCGVATMSRKYAEVVNGTGARILDTRKTIPGWRALDKLAVYLGGSSNHRRGLFDMVLIKDNHIAIAAKCGVQASASWAVRQAKEKSGLRVEVEVDTIEQLKEVLPEEPYQILLDNMSPETMRGAVELVNKYCSENKKKRPLLEASGGITIETLRAVAESGVDCISVGALTHSVIALDIGLDIQA